MYNKYLIFFWMKTEIVILYLLKIFVCTEEPKKVCVHAFCLCSVIVELQHGIYMITYSAVCSHLLSVCLFVVLCCFVVSSFLPLPDCVHTPRRHATTHLHLSLFTISLSLLSFLLTHEFHQHQIIILKNLDHLIFDVYLMHHLFDQFDLLLLNL